MGIAESNDQEYCKFDKHIQMEAMNIFVSNFVSNDLIYDIYYMYNWMEECYCDSYYGCCYSYWDNFESNDQDNHKYCKYNSKVLVIILDHIYMDIVGSNVLGCYIFGIRNSQVEKPCFQASESSCKWFFNIKICNEGQLYYLFMYGNKSVIRNHYSGSLKYSHKGILV